MMGIMFYDHDSDALVQYYHIQEGARSPSRLPTGTYCWVIPISHIQRKLAVLVIH